MAINSFSTLSRLLFPVFDIIRKIHSDDIRSCVGGSWASNDLFPAENEFLNINRLLSGTRRRFFGMVKLWKIGSRDKGSKKTMHEYKCACTALSVCNHACTPKLTHHKIRFGDKSLTQKFGSNASVIYVEMNFKTFHQKYAILAKIHPIFSIYYLSY